MSEPSISPDRSRPPPKVRGTRGWLTVAILIALVWSFAASLAVVDPSGAAGVTGGARTAYLTGQIIGGALAQVLIVAGLVWLVLYFGFTRRLARHRGGAHFVALLLTAGLAAAPITGLKFYGLLAGARDSGAVTAIMTDFKSRAEADGDDLRAEQSRILQGDPFTSRALARPGGVALARERLTAMRASIQRGHALAQTNFERSRAALSAVPMSDERKVALLAEQERGFAAGKAGNQARAVATEEVLDATEAQLDILSREPRGWTTEGGEIVFTSERDMNDFNIQIRRFQAAQARETETARPRPNPPAP